MRAGEASAALKKRTRGSPDARRIAITKNKK
jgi:hypothetical protein